MTQQTNLNLRPKISKEDEILKNQIIDIGKTDPNRASMLSRMIVMWDGSRKELDKLSAEGLNVSHFVVNRLLGGMMTDLIRPDNPKRVDRLKNLYLDVQNATNIIGESKMNEKLERMKVLSAEIGGIFQNLDEVVNDANFKKMNREKELETLSNKAMAFQYSYAESTTHIPLIILHSSVDILGCTYVGFKVGKAAGRAVEDRLFTRFFSKPLKDAAGRRLGFIYKTPVWRPRLARFTAGVGGAIAVAGVVDLTMSIINAESEHSDLTEQTLEALDYRFVALFDKNIANGYEQVVTKCEMILSESLNFVKIAQNLINSGDDKEIEIGLRIIEKINFPKKIETTDSAYELTLKEIEKKDKISYRDEEIEAKWCVPSKEKIDEIHQKS